MKFSEYFNRKPRAILIALALGVVLSVGEMDFATGPMVGLIILCLMPIIFSAWRDLAAPICLQPGEQS